MITTLLYHDVVACGQFAASGFRGADADIYKLEQAEFVTHLEKIERASRDICVGVLCDAALCPNSQTLLFTFDDGGASAIPVADLLETRGWRGHFLITTDYVGKPGFLTASQVRELRSRGHVVGSHSCSHPPRISHCSQIQLDYEWRQSVSVLSDLLGEAVRIASVPGGYYHKRVGEAAAAAGISVLFNSEPTSRVARIDGCLILGRYCMLQGVGAENASRIACGDWPPRLRQYIFWNSKKLAKRLAGSYYVSVRKSMLTARARQEECFSRLKRTLNP